MDDGYIRIRKNRSPRAEIATCGFADADILLLLRALNHLGITAKALRGRIHFGVEATHLLSEKIAPFIPGSMRYKLHPDVRNTVPFNDTLMIPDKPKVFFDEVEVEELLFKGVDRTFYCIDVEETHNFVTAGGVVHNCRPPNNRAPEPDEVATCEGFLHRQIAAIQPKVIVCLGSVATQNLLKTERKISSFRGQWQEWRDIAVMPTYHPAFLLRNPAMKKEVWEDMKKVMELLKKGGKK
ncbi:MAG: hypothetical protein HYY61_04585 [Deltaproteobacteria bacterium]|nr:hypothetical protein [Deltaproteobacteria bacterium]